MTRLCFGSFGTIIKLHSRNKSNVKIVSALVGTIDPDNRYATAKDHSPSFRVMNCKRDFSGERDDDSSKEPMSRILELVNDVDEKSVIENFKSDVIPLIKKEKMESLILSLLFIIENDAAIDVDGNPVGLQKHFGIKVNPLDIENKVLSKVITLSDFLAHTLRYIIKETKNNTTENQAFVKMIKESGFVEAISGKYHVLKLGCTQVTSPEYHAMKINWDDDTQTLVLVSGKTEGIVMNGDIIEQGLSNGMLTETRLLTAGEEVEVFEKDQVSVYRRLGSKNTEILKNEMRNDDASVEPELETLEDTALEKQLYGVRISADMEDEMLYKRTEEDKIFDVFMHAYANLGIHEYIRGRPRRDFDTTPFIKYIEQNVMENYQKHFKTTTYKSIVEFCTELEKFHGLVSLYTQKMSPRELDKLIVQQSEKTKFVFDKIFRMHEVVYQRDHETGDVLCIWESDID